MTYTATIDKVIPGFDIFVREDEGIIDFHYGRSFDKSVPRLYDCGPYTATIKKDGAAVATIQIDMHFWNHNWWYEINQVAVIRSPKFLIDNGYLPPIGDTGLSCQEGPAPGTVTFTKPMFPTSDETGYEPQTGGRGAIGIVTDNASQWLRTGDARNMLTDARAVAGQPIWTWDESTGKLIDLIKRPYTTSYFSEAQGSDPQVWLGPWPPEPADPGKRQPWTLETSHMMEICGVVALATGAPRYVRALQARTIRGFYEDNYNVAGYGGVTIFWRQTRGTAWLGRELFYCYWSTVLAEQAGNLPSDCLASSVFKQIIDNQVTQFWAHIATQDSFKRFGVIDDGVIAWWQEDMFLQMLGLYANKWPDAWGPIYIACLKPLMARLNGDGLKQWPPANPTWYWASIRDANNVLYADYKTLWSEWSKGQVAGTDLSGNNGYLTADQAAALAHDPMNGGRFIKPEYGEYLAWCYAIAYAVFCDRGAMKGLISKAYPRLEQAFTDYYAMMKANGYLMSQCSIAVVPNPPSTIPDPQPQPATGVKIMADVLNLRVGQSAVLGLEIIGGELTEGPDWSVKPDGAGHFAPGTAPNTWVFTADKAGPVEVDVAAEGAGHLTDSVTGTLAGPLATALKIHVLAS
jgi:hypothetical protein